LIIDRQKGKAMVRLTVSEGPQYKIGDFEVDGAKKFSNEEIARFYPFSKNKPLNMTATVKGLINRPSAADKNAFDESAWEDATRKVQEAYANEGYIYASIQPIVE